MELKRIMLIEGAIAIGINSTHGAHSRNLTEEHAKMTLDEERRMVWVEPKGSTEAYFVPVESICVMSPKSRPAPRQQPQQNQGQRR